MALSLTPRESLRHLGRLAVVGLTASLLSFVFFCPRFVLWRGLHIHESPFINSPEVLRATDVLRQLDDPFVKIANTTDSVVQWRLLLPLVGHYLHLPVWLFLAIPHLGCVVTLAYVAHLVLREGGTWLSAFFAAALVGTGSWFFASTGWLTYADSWVLLGLLAVTFSPSRIAVAAACLLEPFIDERFVLALPLAYVTRSIYLRQLDRERRHDLLLDTAVIAGLTFPYVALRIGLLATTDAASSSYLTYRIEGLRHDVPWSRYLEGAWMGLRAAWALIVALVWLVVRRRSRPEGALLGLAIAFTLAAGLLVAWDIGRSMSAFFPAAVLGLVLLVRARPRWVDYGLPALLGLNLLLPASHVLTIFTVPILSLPAEFARYRHPPGRFDPNNWVTRAEQSMALGSWREALRDLDVAIQLDDRSTAALLDRAYVYLRLDDLDAATGDADRALTLDRDLSDAMLVRGIVYYLRNDPGNATRLLRDALTHSPPDWRHRGECTTLLEHMGAGSEPRAPGPSPTDRRQAE